MWTEKHILCQGGENLNWPGAVVAWGAARVGITVDQNNAANSFHEEILPERFKQGSNVYTLHLIHYTWALIRIQSDKSKWTLKSLQGGVHFVCPPTRVLTVLPRASVCSFLAHLTHWHSSMWRCRSTSELHT